MASAATSWNTWLSGPRVIRMDGFGRDELEYLAVGTACHPKVVVNFL